MPVNSVFAPSVTVLSEQPTELGSPDLSLRGFLERFPGLATVDAVAITGSTAAGFANAYSDIDVYAFIDSLPELPVDDTMEMWDSRDPGGLHCTTWMGRYGNHRVDLKLWPKNTPAIALAPFLEQEEPEFCDVSKMVQDFVYRLSVAKPLSGEEYFAEARTLITSSSYGRALARTLKLDTENRLTDVAGQLKSGDVLSAHLSAIHAAALAADCRLVMAGDYCRGQKWLLRRLGSTPAGIDPDHYRLMVLNGPRTGESPAECAHRIASWTRAMIAAIEPAVLG